MSQYKRFFLPIALLLPIMGLGLIWLLTDRDSHQGVEWDVPIAGYDPRDLLRGHYVQFRYEWPSVEVGDIPTWKGSQQGLCIIGTAPKIKIVTVQVLSGSNTSSSADCDSTAKVNPWSEEGDDGLLRDRIYVPQQAARAYDTKLANPKLQGIVRIRINSSGYITPLFLRFQPRQAENDDRDIVE